MHNTEHFDNDSIERSLQRVEEGESGVDDANLLRAVLAGLCIR